MPTASATRLPPGKHHLVVAGCCACAAVFYSLWVLGTWLNPGLDAVNGYVSELAARDQPWSPLFRTGDALAGLLAVATAGAALRARRGKPIGWIGLAVFGAATAVDGALTPMACASFTDSGCAVRELVGTLPVAHSAHEVTSSLAGAAALVAMAGLANGDAGPPARWGWAWCAGTGAATLLTLLALWLGAGAGMAQRVQLAGIATWLCALAVTETGRWRTRGGSGG